MATDTRFAVRILTIAARAVGVGGIVFISIFALDAFEPGLTPGEVAMALAIHLIPSFALLAVLALAWRRPFIGGGAYLVVAGLPFLLLSNEIWVNAMLSAPFALAGILFLATAWVAARS